MFFYLLLVLPGWLLAEPVTHILHEGKFKVRLTCASEDSICVGFKETIKHVARFFENALILKKEIYVAIDMDPTTVQTKLRATAIAATNTAHFLFKEAPGTLIPRALCKQQSTCSNNNRVDFTVLINLNKRFYFASDFMRKQDGYSAIDTLAHEFIHGMGFSTKTSGKSCNANLAPGFITCPGYYENTAGILFFANSFETHIYTRSGTKLTSFIERLNMKNQIPLGDPTSKKPQLTDYHLGITREIEALASTSEELYFKTFSGKKIILRTNGKYKPGTSISHFDKRYEGTKETLMTEDESLYYGVHDLEFDGWRTSPFGPLTLEVLGTMGYQLNRNPLFENSLLGLKQKIYENSSW
ncbi:hypothetical protein DSO57_1005038 [Entomophthora muscae]|uniref:Uncharacterized protein n=1 Tax=Entomophthora muscae TaxID=34485 RepID=A0ACC2UHV5_9FUNG|nr:hypothetical protein DSO57_1005038 [Entomophthora muscae]